MHVSTAPTSLSILTARVLPRLVTAWPGVVALAAMKAAIESVVPATTSQDGGRPNLQAVVAETCPTTAPGIATCPADRDHDHDGDTIRTENADTKKQQSCL